MRNKVFLIVSFTGILTQVAVSQAMHIFDNPHFFRANHFFGEPRFEKPGLTSLDMVASRGSNSTVTVVDLIVLATQNLTKGLFVQLHVPFRRVDLKHIHKKEGATEVSAYIGWTKNYQDTEKIDFIDTSFKLGIIVPTSGTMKKNHPCRLFIGYNGRTAASLSADLSIGAYEWLTIGGHVRTLIFATKTSSHVQVHPGIIYEIGAYAKADHIVRGWSLLCGYSYDRKHADSCKPGVGQGASNDKWFGSWKMHTVHYILEYDFSKEERMVCPRISWYYDQQVSGKNVYHVNMIGGGLGVEFVW